MEQKKSIVFGLMLCIGISSGLGATALTESKFTQVINEVKVVQMPDQGITAAKVEKWVRYPDRIKTGSDSLAELEAVDRTVTRIGANTIFSFGPDRAMNLERGSILFHTPKGKGGGKIQTGGASASVLGTTIIVTATDDGGFKTIVLEGKAQVRLPNGDFRILNAGQLAFVLPGSQKFGPVLTINLAKLATGSGLLNGFDRRLSSLDRIEGAILKQHKLIEAGRAVDTGMLVGRKATEDGVEVVDASLLEKAVATRAAAEDPVVDDPTGQNPDEQDAVISDGTLPEDHLSEVDKEELPQSSETGTSEALVAQRLTIESTTIDLTPYMQAPGSDFAFYGTEELTLAGQVDFVGNNQQDFTLILSGQRLKIKSRARVTATGAGDMKFQSGSEFKVKNVDIINNSGTVAVNAAAAVGYDKSDVTATGAVESEGTSQTLTRSSITSSGGDVTVAARENDLTVSESTVSSPTQTRLTSQQDVAVTDHSNLSGNMISVDAGQNLSVQNSTLNGGNIAMQAAEILTWRNVSMSSANSISLAARTLVLQDVAFASGSTVDLRSELGVLAPNPNTGRAPVAGHVNFVRNVTYGGAPAQNAVGTGIQIRPR